MQVHLTIKKGARVTMTKPEIKAIQRAIDVCDAVAVHGGGSLGAAGKAAGEQLRSVLTEAARAASPLLTANDSLPGQNALLGEE